MTQKNVYQRLGYRVSEEVQLLSEQKWITEALIKIKNQRNCLQIERLHLESLKGKLKGNKKKDVPETIPKADDSKATTSAVYMMQNVTTGKTDTDKEERVFTVDEAFCNGEELDLLVNDPLLMTNHGTDFNMEEEDEEESDDDMFIDMNMLMNGVSQSRKKYDNNN